MHQNITLEMVIEELIDTLWNVNVMTRGAETTERKN